MEGLVFLASLALIYYLCQVFAWGHCHETIQRKSVSGPSSLLLSLRNTTGRGSLVHHALASEETKHSPTGQARDRAHAKKKAGFK